jgi:hypothetical protein
VFVGGDLRAGRDLRSDVRQTLLLLLLLVRYVRSIDENNGTHLSRGDETKGILEELAQVLFVGSKIYSV